MVFLKDDLLIPNYSIKNQFRFIEQICFHYQTGTKLLKFNMEKFERGTSMNIWKEALYDRINDSMFLS